MSSVIPASSLGSRRFYQRLGFEQILWGWLFALPAVLGLLVFRLGPLLASLGLSFTMYDIISPPKWAGLVNYLKLAEDGLWKHSVQVTFRYSVLAIPAYLVMAYLVALLMNGDIKGIAIYRMVWYLPTLVPSVVNAALWRWLLNPLFGPINYPLKVLRLPAPEWLTDPKWVVPSLVLIQLWSLGNSALIFLAALKGVPETLYEAAEVDGAGKWTKFWHITVPMTSSVIFFQLIMGIISSFQVFGVAYVLFGLTATGSSAGPQNSALFYVLYLYRNAFGYFRNGYACAMAWVLFLVITLLTWVVFRTQRAWVYYETEGGGA